jgi:hypothetical protein
LKPKTLFLRAFVAWGAALCLGYGNPGVSSWAADPTATPTSAVTTAAPNEPVNITYAPLTPVTLTSPWTATGGTVSLATVPTAPVSFTFVPAWTPANPASAATTAVLIAPVSITYAQFTPVTLTSPWVAMGAAASPAAAPAAPVILTNAYSAR